MKLFPEKPLSWKAMNRTWAKGLCLLIVLSFMACMCKQAEAPPKGEKTKGEIRMKTYYIGRFSVDIPLDMREGTQSQSVRDLKITEVALPEYRDEKKKFLDNKWQEIENKADKYKKLKDKTTSIVEKRELPEIAPWAKGVLYYRNRKCTSGLWDVLIDKEKIAILLEIPKGFTFANDGRRISIDILKDVATAYTLRARNMVPPRGDYFYTQHGVIALPFLWHEDLDSGFTKVKPDNTFIADDYIRIQMDSTFTGQKQNVSDNMAATIESGFAWAKGVKVDRLRTGKRTVAGLEGQEELNRFAHKNYKEFSFTWEHIAKTNSGEAPGILISLHCPDNGDEKERLKIWDAVLDSMKPMFERK